MVEVAHVGCTAQDTYELLTYSTMPVMVARGPHGVCVFWLREVLCC